MHFTGAEMKLILQRAASALRFAYVNDALAMPVHWFYDRDALAAAFPGGITKLEAAPTAYPHTFMPAPAADPAIGGKRVVGDLILKDRAGRWGTEQAHIHQGMKAGENTLNSHVARLVTRVIAANNGRYDEQAFLKVYIAFMTAEVSTHPDTYAEGYHRAFFTNLALGKPQDECGDDSEGVYSAGALTTLAPVAIAALLASSFNVVKAQVVCHQHIGLLCRVEKILPIVDAYVALIAKLLIRPADDANNAAVRTALAEAASQTHKIDLPALVKSAVSDAEIVWEKFGPACSLDHSWPVVLYFAYKYANAPHDGALAQVNVGGENVHRGILLGTLLGLSNPITPEDTFFQQLADRDAIESEITALMAHKAV